MQPSVGLRFGRFELLSRLGAGGMGEVWEARDHDLGRSVAVKFLLPRFANDPDRMVRFEQEARSASSLNHPNIVTIHEVGEAFALRYIVMEMVHGSTLRELISNRDKSPVSIRRQLEIAAQTAEGLAKAHGAGIVHRDLKPENLMLTTDGFVKILDFGLAKLLSDGAGRGEAFSAADSPTESMSPPRQTALGTILGTAGYMSPEQAAGRPLDFRSDQFSLGAILYEMATGRRAFHRATPVQTLAAIIDDPPEPLQTHCPSYPLPARWIVERCLAKDPVDRYASTHDLARELRTVREHLPEMSTGPNAPPTRRAFPWRRAAGIAAAALSLAAVGWGAWHLRDVLSKAERPPVVAVLPMTNLTGSPELDATAVGLVEVLVGGLSNLQGVQVLSRSATVTYRDRKSDLAGIAQELDARFVLDGTLLGSEQDLKVSLSLVELPSNVVRWSGTFDGSFPRLAALQHSATSGVSAALRASMPPRALIAADAVPTVSPTAFKQYSEALALLDRPDRPGNVLRAITELEAALRSDPRFALAHAALSEATWLRYRETGDPLWADRARDAAQEATRLAPEQPQIRLALARLYDRRGKPVEALEEARRASRLRPDCDEILRLLSSLLVDDGQYDAALDAARRAVALRPLFAPNHSNLGWIHYRTGRFSEAVSAYREHVRLEPDNPWPRQMLGTSLQMMGDFEGATSAYQEALRLAPDAKAWSNLGSIHYLRGHFVEAVHAYEQASRLEPASGSIRRSLGDARTRAGDSEAGRADWRAAIELSQAVLRVDPRRPRELKNIAICSAKLGEREQALHFAARTLEAGPAIADSAYGAAMVFAILGDTPRALVQLERALELGTSTVLAETDDELASLRTKPEFGPLLKRAKKREVRIAQ